MAGFDWDELYNHIKTKLPKLAECAVGRYVEPKKTQFPYADIALADNSGGNYDLEGNEGTQNPLITITVYATGATADYTCNAISKAAKEILLSYGFRCRGGPMPAENTDPDVKRWVGRYQRLFGAGDQLIWDSETKES